MPAVVYMDEMRRAANGGVHFFGEIHIGVDVDWDFANALKEIARRSSNIYGRITVFVNLDQVDRVRSLQLMIPLEVLNKLRRTISFGYFLQIAFEHPAHHRIESPKALDDFIITLFPLV